MGLSNSSRLPISLAIGNILQGKSLAGNVWGCFRKLVDLTKFFFTSLTLSGKIYLASKVALLALNIASVILAVVRYKIWTLMLIRLGLVKFKKGFYKIAQTCAIL